MIKPNQFFPTFSAFYHPVELSTIFANTPNAFHRLTPSSTQLLYYKEISNAEQFEHSP
jgi:hypothetical protein